METYLLIAYSYLIIQLITYLIVFTPGTQLNTYVLLTPVILTTLDRFKRSWLVSAADIWNGLPADMILQEVSGCCTVLNDIQCFCVANIFVCISMYCEVLLHFKKILYYLHNCTL